MADADDPGMTTFPDGYTFTSGQMVQEFEDGTRALEDYALSDIVESSYGCHIILRLPLDPEGKTLSQDSGTGDYMTLRADAANELFNAMLLDWIDTAEVEWQGDFGTMDYNELFAAPETGEDVVENVQKDAAFYRTLGKILPYLLIAVVIAIIVTVLTKKKNAKKPDAPAEETGAEPTAEETGAEPAAGETGAEAETETKNEEDE